MRILALADTQLGSGRSLADDRLADQEAVLNAIADLAHERDVDVVLHVGDVFESRHPGEEERMVFKRWAAKITRDPQRPDVEGPRRIATARQLIVIAGNHDLSNTALASAVDLYDRCEFVRLPTVLDLGGCSLACLPWAPIHNLVAGRESAERGGAYEQAAEALVAITQDLSDRCTSNVPKILAAHWAMSGAALPNGIAVEDLGEPIYPQERLGPQGWDVAVLGHIHASGEFGDQFPPKFYCGSPYPNSFGEPGAHGCWILDVQGSQWDSTITREFTLLPSRPLVTIDCDLTEAQPEWSVLPPTEQAPLAVSTTAALDETGRLAAACAEHFPLTDATVRLRYRATEEQARRIDLPAIRRLLADAGAHRLAVVEPTVIRSGRARAAGVDESLEPLEALAAWCSANQVDEGKRRALAGLLERWGA